MALVNAVVVANEGLQERVRIRNDFVCTSSTHAIKVNSTCRSSQDSIFSLNVFSFILLVMPNIDIITFIIYLLLISKVKRKYLDFQLNL